MLENMHNASFSFAFEYRATSLLTFSNALTTKDQMHAFVTLHTEAKHARFSINSLLPEMSMHLVEADSKALPTI